MRRILQKNIKTSFFSFNHSPISNFSQFTVSLFPGDGIGPEISQSVIEVFSALKLPITWNFELIHKEKINEEGDLISADTLNNLRKNKFALKG